MDLEFLKFSLFIHFGLIAKLWLLAGAFLILLAGMFAPTKQNFPNILEYCFSSYCYDFGCLSWGNFPCRCKENQKSTSKEPQLNTLQTIEKKILEIPIQNSNKIKNSIKLKSFFL